MPLKRVAKANHAVGPRDAECSIVESTAAAQASARLVPGDQWHERDGRDLER